MERADFLECLALYAIDALPDGDRAGVEAWLADSPDANRQLSEYQLAVAAIPYSAPLLPMAVDLKARLMARIMPNSAVAEQDCSPDDPTDGVPTDGVPTDGVQDSPTAWIQEIWEKAQSVQWEAYACNSEQSSPEVSIGKLLVDSEQREIQFFVRASGAVKFPAHRHAQDEEIIVLAGDLVIDGRKYTCGDRIYSAPGTAHQPETETGCLLFTRTSLDDQML